MTRETELFFFSPPFSFDGTSHLRARERSICFRVIYLFTRVNVRAISRYARCYNNIEVHDKYGRKLRDKMDSLAEVFMRYVFQDLLR